MTPLWQRGEIVEQSQLILNSFWHWLGRDLIERSGDEKEEAQRLFDVPFAVVSHDAEEDPLLKYGNATALALWEMNFEHFTQTPSRLTAEADQREERARLLAQTTEHGFVEDYRGVRISKSGRRFRIHSATVWNLVSADGQRVGQAATFDTWEFLP